MTCSFTKVSLPFGWLGNMSPHPIQYNGKRWRTAEALFQALRFEDPAIREWIRGEASPMTAKFVAKQNAAKMVVQPTSLEDVANMQLVLRWKLEQHPQLKDLLLKTGDELIVEDVTRRASGGRHQFWGAALKNGEWVGENTLGKIWMRLRDDTREEASIC